MNILTITKNNRYYFNRDECENVEYEIIHNSQILSFIVKEYQSFDEITDTQELDKIEDKYIKIRNNISFKNIWNKFFNPTKYQICPNI